MKHRIITRRLQLQHAPQIHVPFVFENGSCSLLPGVFGVLLGVGLLLIPRLSEAANGFETQSEGAGFSVNIRAAKLFQFQNTRPSNVAWMTPPSRQAQDARGTSVATRRAVSAPASDRKQVLRESMSARNQNPDWQTEGFFLPTRPSDGAVFFSAYAGFNHKFLRPFDGAEDFLLRQKFPSVERVSFSRTARHILNIALSEGWHETEISLDEMANNERGAMNEFEWRRSLPALREKYHGWVREVKGIKRIYSIRKVDQFGYDFETQEIVTGNLREDYRCQLRIKASEQEAELLTQSISGRLPQLDRPQRSQRGRTVPRTALVMLTEGHLASRQGHGVEGIVESAQVFLVGYDWVEHPLGIGLTQTASEQNFRIIRELRSILSRTPRLDERSPSIHTHMPTKSEW